MIYALGFSLRKRPIAKRFFFGEELKFVNKASKLPAGCTVAVWASGDFGCTVSDGEFTRLAAHRPVKRLYVEDGFIRSIGLGADLIRPTSWVVDHSAIYYDASRPSDLENLLLTTNFDEGLIQRSRQFREKVIAAELTKYNIGKETWNSLAGSTDKHPILVVGQVETDAAIQLGASAVRTNMDLLRAVRAMHPLDWIIYKPHPDVVAGLRNRGAEEHLADRLSDEIASDVSIITLLKYVQAVHVISSLTGFEALLRGIPVVCHGLPFYAGWGLTKDMIAIPRRSKTLDIDKLVAVSLLIYPRYVSITTGHRCSPEQALDDLVARRNKIGIEVPWWRRLLRPFLKHA